jgi:uncharacterized membrane protein
LRASRRYTQKQGEIRNIVKMRSTLPPLLSALLLVSLSQVAGMTDRRDPSTGQIRVLNTGADAVPGTASPLVILFVDPLISAQTVPLYSGIFPTGETDRFMRIYMPRTEARMKSDFDLIMISDATVDNFPSKYFPWMISSVLEEGLGFFTTGGAAMYGGRDSYISWDTTTIVEIFAVAFEPLQIYDCGVSGNKPPVFIRPAAEENPFVTSLPWETCPPINYMIHIVETKQGATTLLEMDVPQGHPILSYWDVGEGRATNLIPDWYPWRIEPFQEWAYYIDLAGNLIYFSAGVEVPQDLELVHRVRFGLGSYYERRTILLSVLAFVEKFGANVNAVEARLAGLDSEFKRAQGLYRDQEWEAAGEVLDAIRSDIQVLDGDAIKLKERALLWIYVIEWLSVASTLSISLFAVWTLMVRRRLYGEVGTTRLA